MPRGYLPPMRVAFPSLFCARSHLCIDRCFRPFFSHFATMKFFVKLNYPIFVVQVGQREKSQKYFDLSAFD